jgi:hypothetical protein
MDRGRVPIVKALADASDSRKGKSTSWREAKMCNVQRQTVLAWSDGPMIEGKWASGGS